MGKQSGWQQVWARCRGCRRKQLEQQGVRLQLGLYPPCCVTSGQILAHAGSSGQDGSLVLLPRPVPVGASLWRQEAGGSAGHPWGCGSLWMRRSLCQACRGSGQGSGSQLLKSTCISSHVFVKHRALTGFHQGQPCREVSRLRVS